MYSLAEIVFSGSDEEPWFGTFQARLNTKYSDFNQFKYFKAIWICARD